MTPHVILTPEGVTQIVAAYVLRATGAATVDAHEFARSLAGTVCFMGTNAMAMHVKSVVVAHLAPAGSSKAQQRRANAAGRVLAEDLMHAIDMAEARAQGLTQTLQYFGAL